MFFMNNLICTVNKLIIDADVWRPNWISYIVSEIISKKTCIKLFVNPKKKLNFFSNIINYLIKRE